MRGNKKGNYQLMRLWGKHTSNRTESIRQRRRSSVSARVARVRATLRSRAFRTQLTHGFLAVVLLVSMFPLAALVSLLMPTSTAQALSQGPRYATSSGDCVNDSSYGGDAWINPGNAFSDNNVNATSISGGYISNYLKCTNFGFTIPTGATIDGITLSIGRSASLSNRILDDSVHLVKGGTVQSTNKGTLTWWPTTETAANYGSSSDLWGTSWSVSDINASNFGAVLSIEWWNSATPSVDYMRITVEYTSPATFEQSSYRWFENQDESGGTIDVGSPLNSVAQNTATTAPEVPAIFRLRLGLHVGTSSAGAGSTAFKLQYAVQGGDGLCDTSFSGETYTDVTVLTPIAYADNTNAVDGETMASNANDPSHSGHTIIRQEYNEANNTAITSTIASGQDGLWDFALIDNNAIAEESYCLRMVKDSGSLLDTYSVVPEITIPASELTQEHYRWYNGQDAVPNNTFAQTWGGTGADSVNAVVQTGDGGYAATGATASYGGGGDDVFVAKYDEAGSLEWSRTWGGSGNDVGRSILQAKDGGIVVAGRQVSYVNGFQNTFIAKYDISGNLLWSKSWDRGGISDASTIIEVDDGNLVMTGYAYAGAGGPDVFLAKFDSSGERLWVKSWGSANNDYGNSLVWAQDGGYAVAGHGNGSYSSGSDDIIVLKFDIDGNLEWNRVHGGTNVDWGEGITQLTNGDFIVAGQTGSYGTANIEATMIRFSSTGTYLSTQTWGGAASERGTAIASTSDGGYILGGYNDTYGVGSNDIMIAKYDSGGSLQWSNQWGGTGDDRTSRIIQASDGGYVIAGNTASYGAGSTDGILLKFDYKGDIVGCSTANCTVPTPTTGSYSPTVSSPSMSVSTHADSSVNRTPGTSSPSASVSHLAGHMTFAKTWGGTSADSGYDGKQTSDGGYIITGRTASYGTAGDMFLTKYDSSGTLSWSRTWGGGSDDYGIAVVQTSDSGYAVTGRTASYGSGGVDMFLAKYDSSGTLSWSRTWGGGSTDYGESLVQTSDGGYAITGRTSSYGAGAEDMFLAKYDSSGTLSWSRTWGGNANQFGLGVIQTSDSGYIVTGGTVNFSAGVTDMFLTKYDSSGTLSWSRTWGNTGYDYGQDIVETSDGYAVAGSTGSYGSNGDMFLAKYDSSGTLSWSRTWGGASAEYGYSLTTSDDGGYVVAGSTGSYGAGSDDVFVAKYDSVGTLQWSRTWGGTGYESANSIVSTSDNGYVVFGDSAMGAGSGDTVVVKYDSTGFVAGCSSPMCQSPTPSTSSPSPTTSSPSPTTASPSAGTTSPTPSTSSPSPSDTTQVDRSLWTDLAPIPSRALAAQDTAASGERHDDPLRLRVGLEATGKATPPQSASLKLQVSPRVGTCDVSFTGESYVDIASSNVFGFYNNTNLADGDWVRPGSQEITTAGGKLYQNYEESANFTNRHYIPVNTAGIWDLALTTTDDAPYNSYCFRVVNSDNSPLAGYTRVFELTIPPAASQQMRHGKFFSEITTGGTSDSRQPFYW